MMNCNDAQSRGKPVSTTRVNNESLVHLIVNTHQAMSIAHKVFM